ncbi:MAG TPA: hypothetical protein DCX53_00505 [Anaerolineae bacterium]|nr:hypothetical protein [Anaerolineae bacterium]
MNLLDKYVAEVGKHLPRKGRADIEAEIRSTLEDMLEERKQASIKDEAATVALLKEYGSPREVAESYIGPRYLISPRIYPLFELVTKIVLSVVFGIAIVGLGISLVGSDLTGIGFLSKVGDAALGLLGGLVTVFGNIVIVFAILDRTLPASEFKNGEEWDPAKLANEPDPDEVKVGEQLVGLLFLALFLILFNIYPEVVGFGFFDENNWVFIPTVLSNAFFNYLPWINILFLIEIGLAVYLIRAGVWSVATRVANLIVNLAGIALAVAMLRGPALVELSPERLAGTPLAESAGTLIGIGSLIPGIILIIVIIISGIEVSQMAYRLFNIKYETN